MLMPGRTFNSSEYRNGYQGSEKDAEIAGSDGAHFTTFYREADTRIVQWWSLDPKVLPGESPYMMMGRNPLLFNDILGDKVAFADKQTKLDIKFLKNSSADFKAQFKALKNEFRGGLVTISRTNQHLNAEGTPVYLSDASVTVQNGSSFLLYNAIKGSSQGGYDVLNVRFTSAISARVPVEPYNPPKPNDSEESKDLPDAYRGRYEQPFNKPIRPKFSESMFGEWVGVESDFNRTTEEGHAGCNCSIENVNSYSTWIRGTIFNRTSNWVPSVPGNGGAPIAAGYIDMPVTLTITATAISSWVTVKVPVGHNGRRDWKNSSIHYSPKFGETPGTVKDAVDGVY